jgi:hypothetical protein
MELLVEIPFIPGGCLEISQAMVRKFNFAQVKFFSHPKPPYRSKQVLKIRRVVSNLWIFYCIDGEVCILY